MAGLWRFIRLTATAKAGRWQFQPLIRETSVSGIDELEFLEDDKLNKKFATHEIRG
jgi:hypothetical protein